jgi:hypothetical protein
MFSQIVTVVQGFLSRGFWFGSFLPVALASGTHAFLAHRLFPLFTPWDWLTVNGSEAAKFPLILAVLIVMAYAMTPLLPWIRGMLDGSLLPGWMHDAMRAEHARAVRHKRDEIGEAYLAHGQFQLLLQRWPDRLRRARLAGDQLIGPTLRDRVKTALERVAAIQAVAHSGRLPKQATVESACMAVEDALRANSAEELNELDKCQRSLLKLLQNAELDSRHRADSIAERYAAVSLQQPQATRMADAKRLTEQYCEEAYSVQFDYLWPRLQLQLPDQGSTADRIASMRAQGDFALLSLVLMLSVVVIWLPLLAWYDRQPWFLCSLGIAAPLALAFFYQLALESETAFGELLKSLVDRYRFDVLKEMLRQPLPPTLAAERELWIRLAKLQSRNLRIDLTYRHPQ